ncbi:MAG: FtsX-like permease family protein [Planctomycetota bacterium]
MEAQKQAGAGGGSEAGRSVADFRGIKIQKQIVLPLSKAIEIAVKSIKIRFARSLITTASIVLAIAFLMSVWVTATIETQLIGVYKQSDPRDEKLGAALSDHGVKIEAVIAKTYKTYMGLNIKYLWLVLLSLMVCLGGIMNAMLMSVHERYKEIGTMKCLGALDSFIQKLFILESSFQGLIGTVLGLIIGLALSLVTAWFAYGAYAFDNFPLMDVMIRGGITLVFGFVISIFGAWYPARVAARMEPAAAMRKSE